jgi:hypothetical protein
MTFDLDSEDEHCDMMDFLCREGSHKNFEHGCLFLIRVYRAIGNTKMSTCYICIANENSYDTVSIGDAMFDTALENLGLNLTKKSPK